MASIPSWFVPFGMAAMSGVGAYYAAQVTLEHRITKLEEDTAAHAREDDRATTYVGQQFEHIWFAINKNAGKQ